MRQLTDDAQRALGDIAARYGVSDDAAQHLLFAVVAGYGTQAQFNHPELGGMGQWSRGGMIMVGDMFNNALKARVDGLCNELAALAGRADIFKPEPLRSDAQSQSQYQGGGASLAVPGSFGNWWPEGLGRAASTGSQNNLRYAFFPESRRLAIDIGGQVKVYDTRDHSIGGFSQQQSGGQSLSFTSQHGLIDLASLDEVTTPSADTPRSIAPSEAEPVVANPPAAEAVVEVAARDDDIIGKIEQLAGLHAKGILTDAEFQAKKADLLGRL
jgi:hypothetical protein